MSSPRSIYLDLEVARGSKPRTSDTKPPALRLVPPAAASAASVMHIVPVTEVAKPTPPVVVEPSAAPASAPRPAPPSLPMDELDRGFLAVLDETAASGESAEVLFRRKEHMLGTMFAALPAPAALALHKRLTSPAPGDLLSVRFSRLVAERRGRLLAFLADAPRREAVDKALRPPATPVPVKGAAS
ncbi:MAG: hypothetical protein IPQ07_11165 [Myxococcales bacterium]|nr:hypothetical protein [Myxococcales bacterium]